MVVLMISPDGGVLCYHLLQSVAERISNYIKYGIYKTTDFVILYVFTVVRVRTRALSKMAVKPYGEDTNI